MKLNKFILGLLIQLISQQGLTQTLQLKGIVRMYDLKDTGKVYYTPLGQPFDSKKFVTYNRKHEYIFTMAISEIKKKEIRKMVFSTDPAAPSNSEYACVQVINLLSIVEDPLISNSKRLSLKMI